MADDEEKPKPKKVKKPKVKKKHVSSQRGPSAGKGKFGEDTKEF